MLRNKENAFVALYVGETVATARIIAASSDSELVGLAVSKMLVESSTPANLDETEGDPVLEAVESGRKNALRLIAGERKS